MSYSKQIRQSSKSLSIRPFCIEIGPYVPRCRRHIQVAHTGNLRHEYAIIIVRCPLSVAVFTFTEARLAANPPAKNWLQDPTIPLQLIIKARVFWRLSSALMATPSKGTRSCPKVHHLVIISLSHLGGCFLQTQNRSPIARATIVFLAVESSAMLVSNNGQSLLPVTLGLTIDNLRWAIPKQRCIAFTP